MTFLRAVLLRRSLAFGLLLLFAGAACGGEGETLATKLPPGGVIYGELSELGVLLERIQHSPLLESIVNSPQYAEAQETPPYQRAQAVRSIIEAQLDMDVWTAAKKLFGDRVAVALYPHPGRQRPDAALLIRGDAGALATAYERLKPFVMLADSEPETIRGVETLTLKRQGFLAVRDSWGVAASTRELLEGVLARLDGDADETLADDDALQRMLVDLGERHLLKLFVNTRVIAQGQGGRLVPEKPDNALVSLVAGGVLALADQSPYAGLTVDVESHALRLTAGVAGDVRELEEPYAPFFSDPQAPGALDLPEVPDLIGGIAIHRNFAQWYRNREHLVRSDVLPEFDKFETGLANILPGKDFGEDVLPLFGRNLRFVAAPQDYAHLDGKPGVQLPGFAVIAELAEPQEGGDLLRLFYQTLTAILNIEAGQQGRKPWIMDSESYHDVQLAFARYLEKPTGERLPIVFNFVPASAQVGDQFIFSSSVGLCRQLVDALQDPTAPAERENRNLHLALRADPLTEILAANRDLIQARRVQEGKTLDEARDEFDALLGLLGRLQSLRLSTTVMPESFRLQLTGSWK